MKSIKDDWEFKDTQQASKELTTPCRLMHKAKTFFKTTATRNQWEVKVTQQDTILALQYQVKRLEIKAVKSDSCRSKSKKPGKHAGRGGQQKGNKKPKTRTPTEGPRSWPKPNNINDEVKTFNDKQ